MLKQAASMLSTGTRHPVRTAPGLCSPAALGGRVPQSHPGLQERLWECFPFGQRGRELHGREAFLSESQGGVRRGTAVPAPEGWAGSAPRVGVGHGAARGSVQRDLLRDAGGKQGLEGFAPSPAPCRGSSQAGGRAPCQRSPCTTADPEEEPALTLPPVPAKHTEQLRGQQRIWGHG